MESTRLGEVEISKIVFGTMQHGPPAIVADENRRVRALHAAFDAGVTTVDTAPLYELGRSEEIVGRAVRGRDVAILTKVGLRWDGQHGDLLFAFPDGGRTIEVRKDSRPESIRWEVEQSLRRLGVSVLDVVQIHHHDPHVPVEESIGALLDLRTEGKLRAIGVCNFGVEALATAKAALGDVPLASIQDRYSLLAREVEASVLPWARERGVPALAYSPLAEGALVGPRGLSADDPRRDSALFTRANHARLLDVLDTYLRPVAHRHGASIAQVALAWVAGQPGVGGVIVGASHEAQARANARVGSIALSEIELKRVGAALEGFVVEPAPPPGPAKRVARKVRRGLGRGRRWVTQLVR